MLLFFFFHTVQCLFWTIESVRQTETDSQGDDGVVRLSVSGKSVPVNLQDLDH